MPEKRKSPEQLKPKSPESLKVLTIRVANLEASLRGYRLESDGATPLRNDSRKHNHRGEEVDRRTGYVYPLPPAE